MFNLKWLFFLVIFSIVFSHVVKAANPVAIPMKYYVVQNKGRHLMLSATSDDITFDELKGPTPNWGMRYTSNRWGSSSAITSWVIDSLPSHGVLYNDGIEMIAPNNRITNPDSLYYKPNVNYVGEDSFDYHVIDSQGKSNSTKISLVVALASDYPMPYGIDNPSFGINEEPPADPPGWPNNEVEGFYYFDNNNPNCTDSNDYGYPDAPRCTLPAIINLGNDSKAVFAENSNITTNRSFITVNFNSTIGHEAWLIGVDNSPRPPKIIFTDNTVMGKNIRLVGENYRISGLEFVDVKLRQYNSSGNNSVVRYSVIHDWKSKSGNVFDAGNHGTNILSFSLFLYNIGTIDEDLTYERDVHAFDGIDQHNWWILDCNVGSTAGDSLQITNNNTTSNIWVGRLTAHSPMENCVDIKDFNNVVVSESDCWDIRKVIYGNSGGNAQNFYVNDEGNQQGYVYFLNNRSWDTMGDTYATANIGGRVYFIGNRGFFSPYAIGLGGYSGGGQRSFYLNSVTGVGRGLYMYNWGGVSGRYVVGNYIGNIMEWNGFVVNPDAFNVFDYNAYKNINNFAWSSTSSPVIGNFSEWQRVNNIDQHSNQNINDNLQYMEKYYFAFNVPSDLLDIIPSNQLTTLMPGLMDFENDRGFGVLDYMGTMRPQNNNMDIGAFEYIENQTTPADVNQDNQITSTDAMLTLRKSLNLDMSQTNWQDSPTTGDVNCDNSVTTADALLLLRQSVGLDMSNTEWCGG